MLMSEVEDLVRRKFKSVDYAFYKVINRYITAVSAEGERFDIIRDGRFVVPGTEELNEPLEELDKI